MGQPPDNLEDMIEAALDKKLPLLARDVALMVTADMERVRREQKARLVFSIFEELRKSQVKVFLDDLHVPRAVPTRNITPAVKAILSVFREEIIEELKRIAAEKWRSDELKS